MDSRALPRHLCSEAFDTFCLVLARVGEVVVNHISASPRQTTADVLGVRDLIEHKALTDLSSLDEPC